ncbi:DUF1003 domain-containing protein [Geomonas sp. RF6]|uniref:DUF1003 domain-containing protein n=1 Tax=Geomonas sp. RF6 TaxID=2897342 RepID=UPI001E350297|nr:DUF1003 domain-containing protein [Geomonas sp. RF6]UFS71622.1 DUF1003 domain-containing protein [Geomonas sp. RF6]
MAGVTRKGKKASTDGMGAVVDRNIAALITRRQSEDARKTVEDRIADGITRFTGSMLFVYLHLMIFGSWIAINLGWIPRIPRFDPSFVVLAMAASVEAIFLSTFVLISQNRMQSASDRRADLDLHVSLLAEHEVTRLISLVTEIAEKMGIEEAKNPELQELAKDVAPERVLDKMIKAEEDLSNGSCAVPVELARVAEPRK